MSIANVMTAAPPRVRCREIVEADFEGLVNLLVSGFGNSQYHWVQILKRLAEHPTPRGLPKYGYLLECEEEPVGVILLIFSTIRVNGEITLRCNVCSWHVKPAFKGYAALLASRALRRKDVTYVNVAPAPHTLPILKAQRYERYCSGWFATVPSLFARSHGARVRAVTSAIRPDQDLQPAEIELLLAHASYGCFSLICESENVRRPFVFMPRKIGVICFAYLVYCRNIEDYVRFAGPLGRYLARRGVFLIALDSNARIPGLVGRYFDGYPKYFKGPDQPRLGDLSYSELAMFRFPGDKVSRDRRPGLLSSSLSGGS
jgi:hypothetical protein